MEREVLEELDFHLTMLEWEHRVQGLSQEEARLKAVEKFGNPRKKRSKALQIRGAQMRRRRRNDSMAGLLKDVEYAARGLFKSKGFTAVVLITLTVGIGSTVAMYSVLDAALGEALPFPEPDRLVLGRTTFGGNVNPFGSFLDYTDYRDQNQSFDYFGAMTGFPLDVTITGGEEPERVPLVLATGDLFQAMSVQPHIGRTFSAEEAAPGGDPALIMSYGYWQRRFGGDTEILGQTLTVNGSPVPVVGVMPPEFHLMFDTDLWLPAAEGGPMTGVRRFHNWLMVGRLKDGVELSEAQAEMDVISSQLQEAYPDSNEDKALQLDLMHTGLVEDYRLSLFLLMGAIGLVLLIACGNVASLLMARGSSRVTEMAVRTALGAGKGRLVRQLLTESLLLALTAGVLGVLLATWLQDLILGFVSLELLGIEDVGISPSLLGFTLLLSLATAVLFGTVPALASARAEPAEDLKEGGRGSTGGGSRFRSGLVVLQVALSVILLIGSGLLIRSFARLTGVDPGFNPENVLTAEVALPGADYGDSDDRLQFFTQLRESIEGIPGVESVGLITRMPILNPGNNVGLWNPEHPPATNQQGNWAYQRTIMPGYFQAMGIPVVEGRDFDGTDVAGGTPVIILNRTAADTLFSGESAMGRQVAVDVGAQEPALLEVVGVVEDHHLTSLRGRVRLSMFFPYDQRRAMTMHLAVRTRGEPESLIRPVQERLWAMNRDIPLSGPRSLEDGMSERVAGSRSMATMLAMFAGVALFLSALGLYGVLAYLVNRKIHEIGIRVALGASRNRVVQLVLKQGMLLVAGGLILGVGGAFGLTRLLDDMLFGVTATDPTTFAGVGVFFTAIALVACLVPAWRALRIDPMVAFRAE
jgi:putative ABC transport system permease protein